MDARTQPTATSAPVNCAAIRVRRARAADIAQIIALDRRVTGLAKPEYWRAAFSRYAGEPRPDRSFLVAESPRAKPGRSILGFIIGEIRAWEFGSAPCGWILALSVEAGARLHGVGQALFDAISLEFTQAGIKTVRTMVARGNRLHLMFFRSQGMMAGPYLQLEKELD
jgi:ribosomal protein S18 acetylase RimI-like enzyme